MKHVVAVGMLAMIVAGGCVAPRPRTDADEAESVWEPALDGPLPVRDSRRGGYWWQPQLDGPDAPGNRGVLYSRGPARRELAGEEPEIEEAPPQAVVVAHPVRVIERIVLNDVLFDYDRSELKPAGRREVERIARYLLDRPELTVVVEGHTDWIASERYNLALGKRRAEAVKKGLTELGVADERITTVSFGESRPIASNETPEGRALNRRAVVNLVAPDDAGG